MASINGCPLPETLVLCISIFPIAFVNTYVFGHVYSLALVNLLRYKTKHIQLSENQGFKSITQIASNKNNVVVFELSTNVIVVFELSTNKKKNQNDDNSTNFDDRFKLRNGKEIFEEKAYLVGVERKGDVSDSFGIQDSLSELKQLADTAGLLVVDSTYQKLASPNPRTYIGSGKVSEIKSAINALDVETVIFDDELSAGQLRNLEKVFGGDVRVCDRTSLILDIFNQRAATHEASLQEYTKQGTHIKAHVPLRFARLLTPMRQLCVSRCRISVGHPDELTSDPNVISPLRNKVVRR
ncbi:uncharacterized protein LOC131627589 [Vicia villosa]|uniref:uncharacterized protein LOC131627589 n=1 Tax=Vicia villosa TaxID=3911 RepID=UPI00273C3B89|nr:uncharacterized protein LOC131627589 [Vicia villosa]